jgi:REP element-mobilizing transposase RayT
MVLTPIYAPEKLHGVAYQLRYSWTGWPSTGELPELAPDLFAELEPLWESDGLRRLEHNWQPERVQITLSTTPHVSPVFLAARIKGRLQHALRQHGTPANFSRKVSVRSIGDRRTSQIVEYVRGQVDKEPIADERFREFLRQFSVSDPSLDFSVPSESLSGRYWYNLHLVLVAQDRERMVDETRLALVRDQALAIAAKKGHAIGELSIVPDHLHIALRGGIEQSPQEIALSYLNNLAYALGQNAVWQFGYYAGTFGEYDMGAVRGER